MQRGSGRAVIKADDDLLCAVGVDVREAELVDVGGVQIGTAVKGVVIALPDGCQHTGRTVRGAIQRDGFFYVIAVDIVLDDAAFEFARLRIDQGVGAFRVLFDHVLHLGAVAARFRRGEYIGIVQTQGGTAGQQRGRRERGSKQSL